MQAVAAQSRRSKLGPIPIPALVGRLLSGVFGTAAGLGNAILITPEAHIREVKTVTLNTSPYVEERGAKLGLGKKQMRRWEKERRVCQAVHLELPNRRRLLVANTHLTEAPDDLRLADVELGRAAGFVERTSELEEIVIIAGRFNLPGGQSETVAALVASENPFYDLRPRGIDNLLIRGAAPRSLRLWADSERELDGRLLSDHPPIELEVAT
jgi:endonuclease/exonuclease/phosphatase family metal-dependent hydrolase